MRRMNLFKILAIAVLASGLSGPVAAQTTVSSYTPLDLDKCKHIRGTAPEDSGSWQCQAFQGIAVHVRASDMRMYISYGANARKEPATGQTLASFNYEPRNVEWRSAKVTDGKLKPFATIARWGTSVDGVQGQVLVITRLPPGAVCHVGYVDGRANTDANVLAQKIADENARTFDCKTSKPIILGNKGPGFSIPPTKD